MLRRHFVQLKRPLPRAYATVHSPHALVFIEHRAGVLNSGSLSALTAASTLGGQVTGVIVGAPGEVDEVVQKARKLHGLNKVLYSTSPQFSPPLPEAVAPLLRKLVQEGTPYTHVVAAHSSSGKSILPRAAAIVDTPQVSDVISLDHNVSENSTTFTRPIYAGNVIETVVAPSSIPFKFFTVRETAFDPAKEGDSEVEVEAVDPVEVPITTEHVETSISKSDRPDLGIASKVVSGGRALKDAETFKRVLDPLANVLGAAVGASRAAVDAGYADNSLQVGQTGKIVAPELYIAIGISGAIQHLAGMKDSKLIVAINKDPDAPIFEIADVGLVADLFEAVPELTEKLQK